MIFYLKGYEHTHGDILEMLHLQSVIRVFAYALLLAVLFIRVKYELFTYSAAPAIGLVCCALAISIATLVVSRKDVYQKLHTFLIKSLPIVDLLIISALVHISNGAESRLAFLYILPCLSLVVFSIRDLLRIAVLSFVAYSAVILIDYFDMFGAKEILPYTTDQIAIISILRMGLVISITIFTAVNIILYVARVISRHIDKKEEAIFAAASRLSDPLEDTSVLLEQIKSERGVNTDVYSKIETLQLNIQTALVEKNSIIEKARESAPMCRKIDLSFVRTCGMCNEKIGLFERFWSIPKGFKMAFNYGQHQNEVHCDACHVKGGDSCEYCEAWK